MWFAVAGRRGGRRFAPAAPGMKLGAPVAVDIRFIVYNEVDYPDLTALFAHLGVETMESCMSFAVTADQGRFEWKGGGADWSETAHGLFAQPRNLLSPSYQRMLSDILTFNARMPQLGTL